MTKPIERWIMLAGWILLSMPAQGQVFTISGLVTSGGQGLAGIPVFLTGNRTDSTSTDQGGTYQFMGVPAGTYTVAPIHPNYMFSPENLSMTLPGSGTTTPVFEATRVTPTGIEEEAVPVLLQVRNYPNPFNPVTTIVYEVATAGPVRLEVFDVWGRSVALLVEGRHPAGIHSVVFDARHLPGGLYLYRVKTASGVDLRPMLYAK